MCLGDVMRKLILKLIAILFTLLIILNLCAIERIVAKASASPCWAAPRELDEILDDCYSIARGTLVGIRDSEPGRELTSIGDYKYYTFDITECYMGDLDGKESIELQIYDASSYLRPDKKPYMIKGNEYVLLISKRLDVNRSDKYDNQSLIIGLVGDKIDGVYYVGDKYPYEFPSTIEELEIKISEFYDDPTQNGNTYGYDYTESSDIREIVDFSEYIARICIIEDIAQIEGVEREFSLYEANVIENIKGQLNEKISLSIPVSKTDIGSEYLVLLMSDNESFCSLSSHYSYIPLSDTEQVEKYLDAYYNPEPEEDIEVTSSNIIKNYLPLYAMLVVAVLAVVIYLISVIYNAVNK